jgi:HlyD family secretion protein
MTTPRRLRLLALVVMVLAVGALAALIWLRPGGDAGISRVGMEWFGDDGVPDGFAMSNGRLEATEVDVASKLAGRLTEVLVREGGRVEENEIVARIDTESLESQRRQAEAELRRSRQESEYASAVVAQRESELDLSQRELRRLQRLASQVQYVSEESVDQARTAVRSAEAALRAARVRVAASEAGVEAAEATIERIGVDIKDSALRAPRGGRVLYRLAEPGEIVGIGGRVLTLLDLSDVYMVIFLPESVVGRVALNAEARIVLDAAPEYVIPATVSYVSARAQFTPKQVETRSARERLSFRVKLQIDPALLARYEPLVKTGVPGIAYVRLTADAQWPEHLLPKLPKWKQATPPPSSP